MPTLDHLPVTALIPHRPPMQLLTRILLSSADDIWSRIELDQQATFVSDGAVSAVITLEYMAQTAAAFFSLQSPADTGVGPRPGMLIGCPSLDCKIASINVPTALAVQVSRASALPQTPDASALVRFTGKVFDLGPQTECDGHPNTTITSAQSKSPVATAAISVFLPAAGHLTGTGQPTTQ